VYFAPPLKEFPLESGIGAGVKNRNDGANRPNKKFDDIFSHVDTIHELDRQSDRHRAGRQKRPRLRIASRGKNSSTKQRTKIGEHIVNQPLEILTAPLIIFSDIPAACMTAAVHLIYRQENFTGQFAIVPPYFYGLSTIISISINTISSLVL